MAGPVETQDDLQQFISGTPPAADEAAAKSPATAPAKSKAKPSKGESKRKGKAADKPAAPPAGDTPARVRLGDACPQEGCQGRLRVLSTSIVGRQRIRYLICGICRKMPANNKEVTPR